MPDYKIILAVITAYFLLILGAILVSRFKSKGTIIPEIEEFLLAGRNLGLPVILMTFLGTLYSTFTVVGVPGAVFTNGIGSGVFLMLKGLPAMLVVLYFGDAIRRYASEHKLLSPYECIAHAYNTKWLGALLTILAFGFFLPYLSLQLVGLGKVLEGISDGEIGYTSGVGFIAIVIAAYLIFGGMRAVAYTDLIQASAIFIGLAAGMVIFVSLNWGGVGELFTEATAKKPEMLTLPGPKGFFEFPMFFSYCVFFTLYMMQPHFLTRMMMAQNRKQVSILAYSTFFVPLIIFIPGMIFGIGGSLLYDDLAESNQLMGRIFADISAAGMIGLLAVGLILIGTIGASMSTADSILMAMGQVFTRDLVRPFRTISHPKQVLITRMLMVVMLGLAFWIGLNPPEVMLNLALSSVAISAVAVPTLLAFRWKHRSSSAAVASIIISLGLLLTLMILKIRPWGFHEGLIALMTSTVIYFSIASLQSFIKPALKAEKFDKGLV